MKKYIFSILIFIFIATLTAGTVWFLTKPDNLAEELGLGPTTAFAAKDTPSLRVDLGQAGLDARTVLANSEIKISGPVNDLNRDNFEIDLVSLENGEYDLKIRPKKPTLRPGRYHVSARFVTEQGIKDYSQDFYWGVLALNTNKATYLPNESAYLQMAVLDDQGSTICDADLILKIIDPQGRMKFLKTKEGTIIKNPECGPNNVIDKPDYYANYVLSQPGVYKLTLTAKTKDGTRFIDDLIEVKESILFEVERIGPTRIYPIAQYEMKIKIKANQDFQGEMMESMPAGFEPYGFSGFLSSEDFVTKIIINGFNKEISWQVDFEAGQTYELTYSFDAPDIAPEFYLLGPLRIGSWREARQWQIASDDPSVEASITDVCDCDPQTTASTITVSDNNTLLLVAVHRDVGNQDETSVVWNVPTPEGLSLLGECERSGSKVRVSVWYKVSPTAETDDVTVEYPSSYKSAIGVVSVIGVDTGNPYDGGAAIECITWAKSQSQYVDVTSESGDFVFSAVTWKTANITGGDDVLYEDLDPGTSYSGGASTAAGAASPVRMDWTSDDNEEGALIGFNINKYVPPNNLPSVDSVEDGPDSIKVGQTINFDVSWTDQNAEEIKMIICKTDSVTEAGTPTCPGGSWCGNTSSYVFTDPISCIYTITSGDVGVQNYYAFACDDEPECSTTSASTQGTFTAKPYDSISCPTLTFTLTDLFNGTGQGFTGGSQANGGVDDYNNGDAVPTDRYEGTWTACTPGNNYCGTGDAFADAKDDDTNFIWSKPCSGVGCSTSAEPPDTDYEWTYDNDADNDSKSASELCSQDLGATHSAGWFLPHQKQLMQAYIDGSYENLEATGLNRHYWSATTHSVTAGAWGTDLSHGETLSNAKINSNYVRCVRSAN